MNIQENRPNIVVDENFIMLEKRLRRRYAERAAAYSNAEAIEQERSGARAFAIAPEAYGDSKFIGGISSFKNGVTIGANTPAGKRCCLSCMVQIPPNLL